MTAADRDTPRPAPGDLLRMLSPASGRSAGEWVTDSIAFTVAVALWLLYSSPEASPQIADWFWPVDMGIGAIGCLSIWWTRRYPLLIAILMIVPGTTSITSGFPALFSVYRAGLLARPLAALIVTAVHIVLALPYHWVVPIPGLDLLTWLIVIPLLYSLSVCIGLLSRARRQVIIGLKEAAAHDRQRYEESIATTRRDERERIAREMHDVLAHRISLLSVHAGALEYRTGAAQPAEPEEIRKAARIIRENAHLAVEDLREVLAVLRDDGSLETARPQPTLDDLPALLDEARAAGQNLDCDIEVEGTARESVQRTVYRLVQEGLTNARKHAPGTRVHVAVRTQGDGDVRVTVTNAVPVGITATGAPGAGAGVIGLTERVQIEGGTLTTGISDGRYTMDATLPGVRR